MAHSGETCLISSHLTSFSLTSYLTWEIQLTNGMNLTAALELLNRLLPLIALACSSHLITSHRPERTSAQNIACTAPTTTMRQSIGRICWKKVRLVGPGIVKVR
jgi:hypothetical protein